MIIKIAQESADPHGNRFSVHTNTIPASSNALPIS